MRFTCPHDEDRRLLPLSKQGLLLRMSSDEHVNCYQGLCRRWERRVGSNYYPYGPCEGRDRLFRSAHFALLVISVPLCLAMFLSPVSVPNGASARRVASQVIVAAGLLARRDISSFYEVKFQVDRGQVVRVRHGVRVACVVANENDR